MRRQIEPLGAAIHQRDVAGEAPAGVQRLDDAHAEPLIRPEQVADSQDKDAHGPSRCGLGRWPVVGQKLRQ